MGPYEPTQGGEHMKRKTVACMLALSFCLSCWAAPADAYERGRPWRSDQPWEKCSVNLGFFLTNFTSDVSLTGSGGGVILNLEDLLGLDATTTHFRVLGHYRAWRRHHFHFAYVDLSRDATKILEADIPETNPPVQAGATVESSLDIRIYKVGYTYSFWNDDRVDLQAGLGFHIMDLGVGLATLVEIAGQPIVDQRLVAEETTLPLPVLNLRGNIAITKRVFLQQSLSVFYINLSGFDGLLLDASLALEGHICRFFGMGMAFNFMRVEIKGDGGDGFLGGGWNGQLDFDYSGISIYGKFFF
jgi:hypothetical protein